MIDLGGRTHAASRHVIDLALGILMGVRGCSEQEAFDDLVEAVQELGAGPGALARALVGLVGGSSAPLPYRDEVMARWGHFLANRSTPVESSNARRT